MELGVPFEAFGQIENAYGELGAVRKRAVIKMIRLFWNGQSVHSEPEVRVCYQRGLEEFVALDKAGVESLDKLVPMYLEGSLKKFD